MKSKRIYCKCGILVAEGDLDQDEKGRKILKLWDKPQGTILKNKSNNPEDWTGECSKCQK